MGDEATIYIEFIIYDNYSDIDFNVISDILGIQPTAFASKGELIRPNLFRKDSYWEYATPRIETYHLEEALALIIPIIKPKLKILSTYIKKSRHKCKFGIVVESGLVTFPSFCFPLDFIKICSILNAEIDGDVYLCK